MAIRKKATPSAGSRAAEADLARRGLKTADEAADARAFNARQDLRKAATDYAAACLLGDRAVIEAAFARLEQAALLYPELVL